MSFLSEVDFGMDNFQKPVVLNPKDSLAQIILNLFLMRPGSMPSMPHIGININSYLYRLEEDIDAEELRNKIFTQCSELIPFISLGDIRVFVTPYKETSVLIIILPIQGFDEEEGALIMGFRQDENKEMLFNYEFEQGKLFN